MQLTADIFNISGDVRPKSVFNFYLAWLVGLPCIIFETKTCKGSRKNQLIIVITDVGARV